MLKKLLMFVVMLFAGLQFAFAEVEVNKADKAALDSIRGIGPKMSQQILDERAKNGDFKDWSDFQARVKGVKEKKALALSQAGLQVNGHPKQTLVEAPKTGK